MSSFGKILVVFGSVIVLLGVFLMYFDKIPFIGKLPGDIKIEKDNFRFYFPLMTCIIISVIVSAIMFLISYLSKK
jgi:hypothetical protein